MKTADLFNNLEFNKEKPLIKVLLETSFTKEIRIAMHKGTQMKKHETTFPIVVEIVDGSIDFGVENQILNLQKGNLIGLDSNVPHDLKAKVNSVIRLTLTKNDETNRLQKVIES